MKNDNFLSISDFGDFHENEYSTLLFSKPSIFLKFLIHHKKSCDSCGEIFSGNPAFCPSCWKKNWTDEELEKSEQVCVIRSKKEICSYAKKSKSTSVTRYVLIEGNISQTVSKAFNAREDLAAKRKELITDGFIGLTTAIGMTIALALTFSIECAVQQSQGRAPNLSDVDRRRQELSRNIKLFLPILASISISGAKGTIWNDEGRNKYDTLPLSSECDLMYKANFRVVRNALDHVILQRKKLNLESIDNTINEFKNLIFIMAIICDHKEIRLFHEN